MTATTAHPWARPTGAVAPGPSSPPAVRRVTGTLHEPNAWTVGILLATGVVLLARHPIARLLGTEVDSSPVTTVATVPAPSKVLSPAPSLALPVAAVPTHAPRDPFRALVTAGGKVLAPVAAVAAPAAPAAAPVASAVSPPVSATPSSTCTGTTHRVAAGDTLWSIAARAVRSSDNDRVTLAWHRIYAANRSTLGADPGLLQVGESICVPAST